MEMSVNNNNVQINLRLSNVTTRASFTSEDTYDPLHTMPGERQKERRTCDFLSRVRISCSTCILAPVTSGTSALIASALLSDYSDSADTAD
jgi:hypothetical protein